MPLERSLWRGLRAELTVKTHARGQKADLARAIGVPRQAISAWLSGSATPNADSTLKLLEWVKAEEGKQKKSAGRVSETRPARTTRKRKARSNAKQSSQ
jgi:transcriptional regulator with XRE-family HTH domain